MTDPRTEALSRLLDGELSPDDEARLRAELASDPLLAARWRTMRGLVGELSSLPLLEPPAGSGTASRPPSGRQQRRSQRWRVDWRWSTLAAAAALVLALGWPRAQGERVLLAGSELISGTAAVVVPGGRVEIDGRVRVDVEPNGGLVRATEGPPEDFQTMRTHLLAAAAGAAVTVTVYEGTARLLPSNDAEVTLSEGESHTLGSGGLVRRLVPLGGPAGGKDEVGSGATGAEETEATIAALEAELEKLRFQAALARGQVAAHEGTPLEWPDGLADSWQPVAFEKAVREAVEGLPEIEVLDVDCSEYPCITLLKSLSEGEDWEDGFKAVHEGLQQGALAGEPVAVGAWNMIVGDDEGGDLRVQGLVMEPAEEADHDRTRTDFRVRSLLEAATERAGDDDQ